jgi:hypothetical protein
MLTGLSDKQIIKLLEEHSLWRKKACKEILGRKDDFIPLLLNILDEAIKDPDSFEFESNDQHIAAAILLANMHEPKAYPKLVSLISYDEDEVQYLWDDLLMEYCAPMLRDTFNGDKSLLPPLMENRLVSPWSRGAAIGAWGMHYFDGHISREEITSCLRRLIHEVYAWQPDDDDIIVLGLTANCIRIHQLSELLADVKSIFNRNGIDKNFYKDYTEYIKEFNDPDHKINDIHIDDPIELMDRWGLFQDNSSYEDEYSSDYFHDDGDDDEYYDDDEEEEDDSIERLHRVISIGRNEPCPCGSGKKYKNCCMGK